MSLSTSNLVPSYAQYKPRINLETLSARIANNMLLLTYLVFTLCVIFSSIYRNNGIVRDKYTNPNTCRNCTNSSSIYTESIYEESFNRALKLSFQVKQSNFTNLIGWGNGSLSNVCSLVSLKYDANLWVCLNIYGCNTFSTERYSNYISSSDEWVLFASDIAQTISTNMCELRDDMSITRTLIVLPYNYLTYNGIYNSLIQISYYDNPTLLFVPFVPQTSISYKWEYLESQTDGLIVYTVFLVICISTVLITLIIFVRKLLLHERNIFKWLPEQAWSCLYMIFLLFLLNPIILFIANGYYSNLSSYSTLIYTYKVIGGFGSIGALCMWLYFSSPIMCRTQSFWVYYTPRILVTVSYYILDLVLTTLIYQRDLKNENSLYYTFGSWSSDIYSFSFAVAYLCLKLLKWIILIVIVIMILYTRYQLSHISYLKNRYLQLSFRYFTLQGSLVLIYIIIRSAIHDFVVYEYGNNFNNPSLIYQFENLSYLDLSLDIVFVTFYATVLAFVYAPAKQFSTEEQLKQHMLASYVITENEYKEQIKLRNNLFQNMNEFQKLLEHQIYVCCIDRAIELCQASYEVYFDQPGQPTAGGSGHNENDLKDMDLNSIDYEYIASYNNETSDTFCAIGRNKITRNLLIMYRGTSCMNNWKTNADSTLIELSLDKVSPKSTLLLHSILKESNPILNRYNSQNLQTNIDDNVNDLNSDINDINDIKDDISYENQKSSSSNNNNNNNKNWNFFEYLSSRINMEVFLPLIFNYFNTLLSSIILFTTMITDAFNQIIGQCLGCKTLYEPLIHEGFLKAYLSTREFIHTTIRIELEKELSDISITGHSLGGGLASLCAYDLQEYTVAPINKEIKFVGKNIGRKRVRQLELSLYTYGSPKVGNHTFVKLFNKTVPNTFRIINDGDVIPGLSTNPVYYHFGSEIVIDGGNQTGSIIINPSYVEKKLIQKTKTSVSAHSLGSYLNGLKHVKHATQDEIS